MTFIKLLLTSSLIYIATMAIIIPTDETSKESAQRSALIDRLSYYILLHYNMELRLVNDYFICDCTIIIYITHATKNISFHILDPMNNIRMSNLKQADNRTTCKRNSTNYDKNNIVVFNYEDVLLPGKYNLYVRVEIPMNNIKDSFETLYINDDKEGNNKEWLFTIGTRTKIQKILPFWNKSKLRTTFNISVKHYQRYTALSNIPIRKFRLAESNKMWTYFDKTALISIDDVALVVSNFHRINLTDTISLWCKPQLIPHVKFASYVIKNVTTYLENYWCNSKRFVECTIVSFESKVDHVAISNLQDEVKQVLEFVFYRETDIIYNEELDTTARKMIIAPLIARRMVQKYIGNLLSPSHWLQQWLNEGFIMFFQAYIADKALPNSKIMNLYVVQIQHELFDLNHYGIINSAAGYNMNSYVEKYLFPTLSHFKGSIIWRMLEGILSPDKFSKVINIYLNDHYTEPFEKSSNNLWNVMQSIIAELDSKYQFNVISMVHSWAMKTCFPMLMVRRNYYYNIVTISAQFYNKLDEKQYYIPITYTTESKSNFTATWSNIWITPSNSEIELFLEKDQWIIFNLQQAGYYRVSYDIENWRKIARYLNSEEYINIHVLNRAQIIDDAFYFAIEEKILFSLFLELATYLQQEKDYIAWYPMIKAFEFMSNIVAFFEFYPHFKKVQKPLALKWNLFSENNNDDHTECLKQELAKWKCIIDDLSCIRWAHQQLERHLINSTRYKLLPGWKRWTYCNGLRTPDRFTWDRSFNFSMKKIDYTILECLAYSGNFQIIFDYLENKLRVNFETFRDIFMTSLSYDKSKSIERAEGLCANIFLSALAKNTKYMLKDILNDFRNFTYCYGKVNEMAVLTVIINNAYSKEQLGEIKKFIRNEIREFRYPFAFLHVAENKIATRWSEIERQTKYFQFLFIEI